jgi:hypothetical protein
MAYGTSFQRSTKIVDNPDNQDVRLPILTFFDYIDVRVSAIHHTDTVGVAVACLSRPRAIDVKDILHLYKH